jgi:hypothetical protein
MTYVDEQHERGGGEEQLATADFFNQQRTRDGDDPAPDSQAAVDFQLRFLVRDSHLVEYFGQVVRDDGVAGPLREESECNEDQETMAIALGLQEFKDAVLGVLFLERKRSLNLPVHELHGNVLIIVERKVVREDFQRGLRLVLLDIPARRFPARKREG